MLKQNVPVETECNLFRTNFKEEEVLLEAHSNGDVIQLQRYDDM